MNSWRSGYGVIQHSEETIARVELMLDELSGSGILSRREDACELLRAADRIASQGMWLVAHMTYAESVYTDGRALAADDFKEHPEGHTGGALNMAIAYAGYLLANALSGHTRAWLMEQGHCVAAIDAINVLVNNTTPAHAERYSATDVGLTQLVNDFYRCAVGADGQPEVPLGSHVNAYTAGGILEGGYLGFAGLQYVHMPLPGQRLVAFLSDGAFEEQRGPDWAPRWWRAEDCGLVAPIMIANGRRIDQRTTMQQSGGSEWFMQHLQLNGFEPIVIDGRDPAAFAWAILTQERHLVRASQDVANRNAGYPVRLPYVIAETVKGFGFANAGTNNAHNLPLGTNPKYDAAARNQFNESARKLWVAPSEFQKAQRTLNNHASSGRPRERDHALADIQVADLKFPAQPWRTLDSKPCSSMAAIDAAFVELVKANPSLRVRVGNPDELRSNRLNGTLDLLKHRVTAPEPGNAEAIDGAVISALNEEAVACAALANKQGLNLIASYEAFASKMLGSLRQEIIFSRHRKECGRHPGWLSVPVLATSHVWENGKNEQSHQDPTVSESLLGEMSDVSRVLYPIDANTAIAAIYDVYATRGVIATLVVAKNPVPVTMDPARAALSVEQGIALIDGKPNAAVQIFSIGAYQLQQALLGAARLRIHGLEPSVWAVIEPGKFRVPRDTWEEKYCSSSKAVVPAATQRLFFCHTRPEIMLGTMRTLDLGPSRTRALGYINRGGTLDTFGMLFANRSTWAHGVAALAETLEVPPSTLLSADEICAVQGTGDPSVLR
jgi:phosphoketolase